MRDFWLKLLLSSSFCLSYMQVNVMRTVNRSKLTLYLSRFSFHFIRMVTAWANSCPKNYAAMPSDDGDAWCMHNNKIIRSALYRIFKKYNKIKMSTWFEPLKINCCSYRSVYRGDTKSVYERGVQICCWLIFSQWVMFCVQINIFSKLHFMF